MENINPNVVCEEPIVDEFKSWMLEKIECHNKNREMILLLEKQAIEDSKEQLSYNSQAANLWNLITDMEEIVKKYEKTRK